MASGYLETPIVSSKQDDDLGIGIMLGGKYGLIDQFDDRLYPRVKSGIPYQFRDYLGKNILSRTRRELCFTYRNPCE